MLLLCNKYIVSDLVIKFSVRETKGTVFFYLQGKVFALSTISFGENFVFLIFLEKKVPKKLKKIPILYDIKQNNYILPLFRKVPLFPKKWHFSRFNRPHPLTRASVLDVLLILLGQSNQWLYLPEGELNIKNETTRLLFKGGCFSVLVFISILDVG